jgi:hypothetical protein
MPLHYRQGDLLFLWQETRPSVDLNVQQSTIIVVGEATGHAHRLQSGTIQDAPDGALYLDITHTTQVERVEHRPITLSPGLWLVVRQREYSPEAIRTVLD